jgi:acetyltransferase-like isoleucine patch superfamily enzyme
MQDPRKRIATIDQGRPVVIEDDVWIGLNAIVLPGTLIGAGSIIGAGAVVSGVIPPRSIVRQAVASVSSATAGLVPGGAAWPE